MTIARNEGYEVLELLRTAFARLERHLEQPPEHHTPEEWTSVILANLTEDEYAICTGSIRFSGATGKGAVKGYEPHGPYIATFLFELPKALRALNWTATAMTMAGNQLIVRRDRRHR